MIEFIRPICASRYCSEIPIVWIFFIYDFLQNVGSLFNVKQAKKAVSAADKQAAKNAKAQKKVQDINLKKNVYTKKVGAFLDLDEFDALKTEFGSDSGIADFAASRGIRLDPAITNPKPKEEKPEGDPAVIPEFKSSIAEGDTPAVFDYKKGLDYINAQGNINTNIQNIESEANKYIGQLNKDVGIAQTEATRYVADRQLERDLGVENIRSKGAIDLQGIINAGAANVETIRGNYGLKGKQIDRDTAILGGLVSAFNF